MTGYLAFPAGLSAECGGELSVALPPSILIRIVPDLLDEGRGSEV